MPMSWSLDSVLHLFHPLDSQHVVVSKVLPYMTKIQEVHHVAYVGIYSTLTT